jgi:hypothetical protein
MSALQGLPDASTLLPISDSKPPLSPPPIPQQTNPQGQPLTPPGRISTGITLPVTKTINGQEIVFKGLSFNERMKLQMDWRAENRAALVLRLDENGVEGDARFATLNDFDSKIIGEATWGVFFDSDEGKLRILAASADKGKANTGKFVRDNYEDDQIELMNLCAAITHTPLFRNVPQPPAANGDGPNGAAGATKPGMRPQMQKAFGQL